MDSFEERRVKDLVDIYLGLESEIGVMSEAVDGIVAAANTILNAYILNNGEPAVAVQLRRRLEDRRAEAGRAFLEAMLYVEDLEDAVYDILSGDAYDGYEDDDDVDPDQGRRVHLVVHRSAEGGCGIRPETPRDDKEVIGTGDSEDIPRTVEEVARPCTGDSREGDDD